MSSTHVAPSPEPEVRFLNRFMVNKSCNLHYTSAGMTHGILLHAGLVGPGTRPDDGAAWPGPGQKPGSSNPSSDENQGEAATGASSGASPPGSQLALHFALP